MAPKGTSAGGQGRSPLDWLDDEVEIIRPTDRGNYRQKLKIINRLAELIGVNKGHVVPEGWGKTQAHPKAPYCRVGLTLAEAFELTNLMGILNGYCECLGNEIVAKAVFQKIQNEMNRVKKEGFDPLANAELMEDESTKIQIYTETDLHEIAKVQRDIRKEMKFHS